MRAPDKIYVSEELLKEHNWNQVQCKDTEYIRKEALLEWAYKDLDPAAYLQLKNKLEEM